jgi:hypothetical protein
MDGATGRVFVEQAYAVDVNEKKKRKARREGSVRRL